MIEVDIEGYKLWLVQNGRKLSTAYRHANLIKKLSREVDSLSQEEITRYAVKLNFEGRRASYVNMIIDCARVYCRYKGLPEHKIKHYPDDKDFLKATMTDEEIENFLRLPCALQHAKHRNGKMFYRRTSPLSYDRMTMFWKIAAFTGLRMGEIAKLKRGDIDLGRDLILIIESKTGYPRQVPIATNIRGDIKNYMANLVGDNLFPSARGGKSSTGNNDKVVGSVDWGYSFHQRIKRLGIERRNLSPYSFRHSLLTRLTEEDVSVMKIMKIAGHRNIKTTLAYSHLTTKDIQDAIAKHPLVRRSSAPEYILQSMLHLIRSFNLQKDERFTYSINETENGISVNIDINQAFLKDTAIRYEEKRGVIKVMSKIPN
jgi:integrase